MPKPKDHDFKVRVSEQLRAEIVKIAEGRDESMSVVLREALLEFVERHRKDSPMHDTSGVYRIPKRRHPPSSSSSSAPPT